MVQIPSTNATCPSCHESVPVVWLANDSGRNTDCIPWTSHFRGNSDPRSCIHTGRWLKTKKTPDVNCRTRTTVLTIARAPRPGLETEETAMPTVVKDNTQSDDTQETGSYLMAAGGN